MVFTYDDTTKEKRDTILFGKKLYLSKYLTKVESSCSFVTLSIKASPFNMFSFSFLCPSLAIVFSSLLVSILICKVLLYTLKLFVFTTLIPRNPKSNNNILNYLLCFRTKLRAKGLFWSFISWVVFSDKLDIIRKFPHVSYYLGKTEDK